MSNHAKQELVRKHDGDRKRNMKKKSIIMAQMLTK